MKKILKIIALTTLAVCTHTAHAQPGQWPERSVRLIVPFAPGGTADAMARHLAVKLGELWGQSVVVDNRPGGNTLIAASEARRAKPDGYTLFQSINSTLTINQSAFSKLPYDPINDFTHIGFIASVPLIVVGSQSLPGETIEDLISLAKSQPGKVTMGVAGVGMQLAAEKFLRDTDIKVQYVNYKSGADVMRGLLSGEIQSGIDGIPAYPPFFENGKLKALATTSPTRTAALPKVRSLTEVGYTNSEAPVWHAIVAPSGLPDAIKDKVAADLQTVLAMPDLKKQTAELGLIAEWKDAAALLELINAEAQELAPMVKDLDIKLD
ncbi:tripartite tricarboxylate transporter substrate binding protein [Alcaligenaceae bacterium]|nr:tripartite tricarboxylate transporter substrate binding protein [Alcaligenaceae bacterium]